MPSNFAYSQIGGTLGKDPESRSTPGGVKVVNFSVAVEKGFGEKKHVEWFNVVSFREAAEFADKYLKKGKSVRVSGELQTRSYDDKSGQKKYVTEIVAHKIDFGDSDGSFKSESKPTRSESVPQTRAVAAPETRSTAPANDDPFDDDIPSF